MHVTLRQLEYAVAVADHRHFGRAATACHVSQPGLSSQVGELERTLGVQLFERTPRGVLVTEQGERVLAHARRALAAVADLGDAVHAGRGLTGRVHLGVIPTVAPYVLPAALPMVRAAHPDLRLVLTEDRTLGLLERLAAGRLDVALLALPVPLPSDVTTRALVTEPFVAAVPAGHALAARVTLDIADLTGEHLLLLEDGHCLRDQALEVCGAARPDVAELEATSLTTLVQMVAGGMGVTLLPASAAAIEIRPGDDVVVRPFSHAPTRTLGLVWRATSGAARYEELGDLLADAMARRLADEGVLATAADTIEVLRAG